MYMHISEDPRYNECFFTKDFAVKPNLLYKQTWYGPV